VLDSDAIEEEKKKKEETKKELSKLMYKHAVFSDSADIQNSTNGLAPEPMSVKRIQLLDNLAKSSDLPSQGSNNVEAMQKAKRRKRSLTATDIQIGNQMPLALQEDKEVE